MKKLWIEVRSSLWFVPGLLVLAAIGLALGLVEIDLTFAQQLQAQRWQPLLNTGAEGARGMLTAIAGSMITVAGVAFSMTIVTLSLASTQYTPRILRNFMRDRANQFVLGVFVAIFAYCLIVLRTIRGGAEKDGSGFVPLLAVAFAMLLALLSIGCLIFFIHHVATSIQASTILTAITKQTMTAIEALFPKELGEEKEDATDAPAPESARWHPVAAKGTGYLQHISSEGLLGFAEECEAILRLERRPGNFVAPGAPLVSSNCELDKEAHDALRALFVVGEFRTVEQDAGFGIRQIVDIALKALSPGVNDTSTAVSCLDYLGAILSRLARQHFETPFRKEGGALRVIAPVPSFAEFVAKSFDEIRLSAEGNVTIILQMLRVLGRVGRATKSAARQRPVLEQARLILQLADRSVDAAYDRARINQELETIRAQFGGSECDLPGLLSSSKTNEEISASGLR